jgi:hypothetical protein
MHLFYFYSPQEEKSPAIFVSYFYSMIAWRTAAKKCPDKLSGHFFLGGQNVFCGVIKQY